MVKMFVTLLLLFKVCVLEFQYTNYADVVFGNFQWTSISRRYEPFSSLQWLPMGQWQQVFAWHVCHRIRVRVLQVVKLMIEKGRHSSESGPLVAYWSEGQQGSSSQRPEKIEPASMLFVSQPSNYKFQRYSNVIKHIRVDVLKRKCFLEVDCFIVKLYEYCKLI